MMMTDPRTATAPQLKLQGDHVEGLEEPREYQSPDLTTSEIEDVHMKDDTGLPLFTWRMPSSVVPFPLVRRRAFIRKTAANMITRGLELGAKDPVATGEKLLTATLRRQREVMQRRGIDIEVIEAELKALECAVRVEHARLQASGAVA